MLQLAEAGELASYLVKRSTLFPAYRDGPAVSYSMEKYIGDYTSPITADMDPVHYSFMQELMVRGTATWPSNPSWLQLLSVQSSAGGSKCMHSNSASLAELRSSDFGL